MSEATPNPTPKENEALATLVAEQAELTARNSESIEELKKGLLSKAERGSHPGDDAVQDLEKRLADLQTERDAELRLVTKQLEELRLAVASGTIGAAGAADPHPCRHLFGDYEHAKKMIHLWAGAVSGETRVNETDTTLLGPQGALQAEVGNAFLNFIADQSGILSRCQTIRMLAPTRNLDELVVSAQNLRLTVENAALAISGSVSIAQKVLTAVGTGWTEDISLEFLEENIERAGAEDTIARTIGTQYGNDLADLGWNGDGATAGFLITNEGWMKKIQDDAAVHDVDMSAGGINPTDWKEIFVEMMKVLPAKFVTFPGMAFTVPTKGAWNYADELGDRATALGDSVLADGLPALRWFGIPVHAEPFFNSSVAAAKTDDTAILTANQNLVHGIMRDIETFLEFKPRTRVTELTIHGRNDYQIVNGDMIVRGHDIIAARL